MVDIVSAIFSGLALIVSLYAALTANTSAAASIRSTNCSTIFDDYLIKKFLKHEQLSDSIVVAIYVMEIIFVMFSLT